MKKFGDKKGYTLAEVLMVVAIIAILLALAVPAIFTIQKNLRQKEMDSKAETIYMAVQNKINDLYTGGNSDKYINDSLKELGAIPKDADGDINEDGVYYFTSDSPLVTDLVGDDVIDGNLSGTFVVEVIPYAYRETGEVKTLTVPSVYAVFYSESSDYDLTKIYELNKTDDSTFLSKYRASKNNRIKLTNGYLGYYGGGLADGGSSSELKLSNCYMTSEDVVNNAYVKLTKPLSVDGNVTVTFKLSDDYGNTVKFTYDTDSGWFINNGKSIDTKNLISVSNIGINYNFTINLDSLTSDSTRFKNTFGANSKFDVHLVEGSDITLTVDAECDDKVTQPANTVVCKGNSIFDYDEDNTKDNKTALISNPRHLQNLDINSNVTNSNITIAKLIDDISFMDGDPFDKQYEKAYYHGNFSIITINSDGSTKTNYVPNFASIANNQLEEFDGNNKYIYNLSTTGSGLIDSANNLNIHDVTLTGETITSSNVAGGLIGAVNGNVTINNVKNILSGTNNDYPSDITSNMNLESLRWFTGNTVGGLVGLNNGNLTITNSNASTVLGNDSSITGGLVGLNDGSLTIDCSYGDNYLYGSQVGGLVGSSTNSNITIFNAYAAGFAILKDKNSIGAGLVNGDVNSIKNSYTILANKDLAKDKGVSVDNPSGKFISSANNASSCSNLYYLISSTVGYNNFGNQITDVKRMSLSDKFVNDNSVNVTPYKLMGQSLSNYKYPKLKDLDHYGDWDSEFSSGSLVYYETYSDGSSGFDGAGVEVTLKGDNEVFGDGYGVVFKDDLALPETFDYKINGKTYSVNTNNVTPLSVVVGNYKYYIYPLDKSIVNPTSVTSYYTKVEVSANGETKYFNYNPHFAKSVVEVNSGDEVSNNPSEVSIKTARQLYNLSKYYAKYSKLLDTTYKQGRNINYSSYCFVTYSNFDQISYQSPIGLNSLEPFKDIYDGSSYTISNISFMTNGYYVGMFGCNAGTIKNTVLAVDYNADNTYYAKTSASITTNKTLYSGILVGYNLGTISNSAVAGYYNAGNNTIYGYQNSTVYIGGFVGYNQGKILNCSSANPKLAVNMYRANCYTGGFVGSNLGSINDCYDLNDIESTVQDGKTVIAGFAGENNGSINNSYCATVLTSSGEGASSYSFSYIGDSGSVKNSYYLFKGSYKYIDKLYSFGGTGVNSTATYKTYDGLISLASGSKAVNSKNHINTNEATYPFKAVVKDASGKLVHYGEWTAEPELGTFGMFYWEKESGGQNDGYKITYIGGSNGLLQYDSTLCTVHDDGGYIEEYGYGYYVMEGEENEVTLNVDDKGGLIFGGVYTSAQTKLQEQIKGFKFYPYLSSHNSSNNISLKTGYSDTYGTISLTYTSKKDSSKNQTLTYRIAPFFGNSFSLISNDFNTTNKFLNKAPGVDIPFEIRSATQLQYINWNSDGSVDYLVNNNNKTKFNYLMYTTITGTGTQSKTDAGNSNRADISYKMSHDINASNIENFTPIAGQGTTSSSGYNATLYAWFGSSFNGDNYKISELNINSKSFTVGLFGVTAGSKLENIILYSTKGASIIRETTYTDSAGAYALGGLCGIAYDYSDTDNSLNIENCAIAGYKIIDNSKNKLTLGEANVGGLVGVSNISINKCSAVVDIIIKSTHKSNDSTNAYFTQAEYGNFIRVGGLSGAVQYKVTNSYTGGSIKVEGDILNETYNAKNAKYSSYINSNSNNKAYDQASSHIYLSGIAGSGFAMNYQNFTGKAEFKEGYPTVENCYTYISFPKLEGTIRAISMISTLADRYSNASSNATIKNCFYLNTSANFEVDAPKYYFSGNYNNSPSYQIGSYKAKMITGDLTYLFKIFKNESGSAKVNITNLKSVTYDELNDIDTMTSSSKLGSAFSGVSTTDEQGQTVDGKYSFNAGNDELNGKNYPFPTVIKQSSNNQTFNVHYGSWPTNNAYFENGTYSFDIFKNIDLNDVDKYAYVDLKLIKLANESFDKDTLNIQILNESGEVDNSIAELVKEGIIEDGDGNYTIKVRANNTGTVTVKATWSEDGVAKSAECTLTITANLEIEVSPTSSTLEENKSVTYHIGNTTSNYLNVYSTLDDDSKKDYSSLCTWNFTTNKIGNDDAVRINSTKTNLIITSNGYNASVTATATYDYHGNKFSANKIIDIKCIGGFGISDSNQYNEAYLRDSDTANVNGEDKKYDESLAPKNDSTYFIYDRNLNIFSNENINTNFDKLTINVSSASQDKDNSRLSARLVNDVTETSLNDENLFYSLPIKVLYRLPNFNSDTDILNDVTLTSTYTNEKGIVYTVSITTSVEATPYKLCLDANDGLFEDNTNLKEIEVRSTVDTNEYIPTRVGYTFDGWYLDDTKYDSITPEQLYASDSDVNLTAKWSAIKGQINLDLNYGDLELINIDDIEYDTSSIDFSSFGDKLNREGYALIGFYYYDGENNTLVLDEDGNVVNQELFNQLVLNSVKNKDGVVSTLTAKWYEGYTLKVVSGNNIYSFLCKKDSTVNIAVEDSKLVFTVIESDEETNTYDVDYSMKFFGLYNSEGKQIISENGGSLVMNTNTTLTLEQGSVVTFKTRDESATFGSANYINGLNGSFNATVKSGYEIVGWYDVDGNQVLNAEGEVLDGVTLEKETTVYARFKTSGYVKANTMETNKSYVITSGTRILTRSGNSISSDSLSTAKDASENVYIPSSNMSDDKLWSYDGTHLKNNGNNSYLAAYYSWRNYYLQFSDDNNTNWAYTDEKLYRTKQGLFETDTYYIYLSGTNFKCSESNSSSIELYVLNENLITDNYD